VFSICVFYVIPFHNAENYTIYCSGKLLKCSSCQYVYYCNRSCQKESWPIHKIECPHLKKVLKEWKIVPDAARLMARIILKLNQGGADEVDYYTETTFRKFKDLMSRKYF